MVLDSSVSFYVKNDVSFRRHPNPGSSFPMETQLCFQLYPARCLCARTAGRGCHVCFGGFEASQFTNSFALTLEIMCFLVTPQSSWSNVLQWQRTCSWVIFFNIMVNCPLTLAKPGFLLCPMGFEYLDKETLTCGHIISFSSYVSLNNFILICSTVLNLHEASPKIQGVTSIPIMVIWIWWMPACLMVSAQLKACL